MFYNTKKKKHFEPINIVYEPLIDDGAIKFFFTDSLKLAFRSYIGKKHKGDYRLFHPTARQCYYCDNYLICSKNEFLKHVKKCTSIEGIICKFEKNYFFSR